ncbi:MAG TPA: hypothetical protein VKE98_07385 [Gemmataceae bacterium]|nr:hypothetical protein [Gemmataceae bacterium]
MPNEKLAPFHLVLEGTDAINSILILDITALSFVIRHSDFVILSSFAIRNPSFCISYGVQTLPAGTLNQSNRGLPKECHAA